MIHRMLSLELEESFFYLEHAEQVSRLILMSL